MKTASYEKAGIYETVEYISPLRWEPLQSDFRINAFGIHEVMPPVVVDRPDGTGDYLFMIFHDPVCVQIAGHVKQLSPGSLVVWPRGAGHCYGQKQKKWDHSWIHCNGTWVKQKILECGIVAGDVLPLKNPGSLETCLWRLYAELTNHQQPDPVILKNIFHTWLRELMRDAEEGAALFVPEKVRWVKQYLDQHANSRITLKELAEKAGMSIPHLSAEFKRYCGESPINYLIGIRLQQARYLLLDRQLQITEIASRVGYDDIYHFSKLFKKRFGMSPRAMRNSPP
jgi:AraC-like DNA-binding protein